MFATISLKGPILAVFLTSRSNQKRWRGPSHFFFSPTTLSCPKNILSPKSETLFFPAPLHPRKKTGVQLFFRGRTHRKNAHCGPGRGNGKELEPHIFRKMFTQLGLTFPKIWGSNSLPFFQTASTCALQEIMTATRRNTKIYNRIQPEIFNRYEAKFFSIVSWRPIFGGKLAPIGCTFPQNMSLQLLPSVPLGHRLWSQKIEIKGPGPYRA